MVTDAGARVMANVGTSGVCLYISRSTGRTSREAQLDPGHATPVLVDCGCRLISEIVTAKRPDVSTVNGMTTSARSAPDAEKHDSGIDRVRHSPGAESLKILVTSSSAPPRAPHRGSAH